MAPTLHSPVGASGAHRWGVCPGSVPLIASLGDAVDSGTSEYAAEGTAAHMLLEGHDFQVGDLVDVEGHTVVVDAAMVRHVEELLGWFAGVPGVQEAWSELPVELGADFDERAYGTADMVGDAGTDLYVADLKYGEGLEVEVKGNPQIRYYALGVINTLMAVPDRVHLTIAQPRTSGPPRETEVLTYQELVDWGEVWLKPALRRVRLAEESIEEVSQTAGQKDWDREFLQAGNHCRFCPAKLHCPAFEEHVAPGMDVRKVKTMTDGQIGSIIERKSMIRKFLSEVEKEAFARRMAGKDLGGPKIVNGKRYRVWKDNKKAEAALVKALGQKAFVKKLLTPPGLEDLAPEGYKKILAENSFAQPGALTLVDSSDSRPEVTIRTAGEAFAHLTNK